MKKYTYHWGDLIPISQSENNLQSIIKYRNIFGNDFKGVFSFSENQEIRTYTLSSYIEYAMEKGGLSFLDKEFTEKYFLDLQKAVKNFWEKHKIIRNLDFDKLTDQELIEAFKEVNAQQAFLLSYFRASQNEWTNQIEKAFKNRLKELTGDEKKAEELFMILSMPIEFDVILKSEIVWINLVLENEKVTKEMVLNFGLKYPVFQANNYDTNQFYGNIFGVFEKDSKEKEKLRKRKEEIMAKKKESKQKQKEILEKLNDEKINYYTQFFQKTGVLRYEVKNCWAGQPFYVLPLYEELSKRAKVDLMEMAWFYREEEVEQALQGKLLDKDEIERRKKFYIYWLDDGKIIFESGEKARNILNQELGNSLPNLNISEFKGQKASLGKAQGKVRVVKAGDLDSLKKEINNFEKGEILVTQMTQPNMTILMEKAAAIITDEGGIASHAAVVSREFGIPCIVGSEIATRILKTGDLVEVDAEKGIVRKIEK
ncbi:MAG: hypothetical protein KAT77_00330 [Nanoarchaeota archaeon]|nr:hypothetical protein [Nanoarchaeota archaeon]